MNIDDPPTTDDRVTDLGAHSHISENFKWPATRHPIDFVLGSMLGFSVRTDGTALFRVRWNPRWRGRRPFWKIQITTSLKRIIRSLYVCHHRPYFALGLYKRLLTHTSDTTGDWTLISHVRYKEKERKGRFGEISEKITREDRGVCAFVWF